MWMAWDQVSPFEPDRQDLRIGKLGAHLMAALNPGKGYSPADIMPQYEPAPPQSEDDMKSVLNGIFGRIEKRIKDNG